MSNLYPTQRKQNTIFGTCQYQKLYFRLNWLKLNTKNLFRQLASVPGLTSVKSKWCNDNDVRLLIISILSKMLLEGILKIFGVMSSSNEKCLYGGVCASSTCSSLLTHFPTISYIYKTFISQPNAISLQFCMIYMIYKLSQTRESTLYWELD